MPIQTDKNTSYGPPLVNQKYAPLHDIKFDENDRALYSALLTNRWNLLKAKNILPQYLGLSTDSWSKIISAEKDHLPPLVVISSNRSKWISNGLAAARSQLKKLQKNKFAGPSDLTALTAKADQAQSPPLYCPSRTGGNRNVYIVVHMFEYSAYKKALQGSNITVIGWQFNHPKSQPNMSKLTGFGASRFAAIEFCKQLRTAATINKTAPWNYAWLMDDNVVALTSFPGYAAVEDAMDSEEQDCVCAGFQGGTKAEDFGDNRDYARREVEREVPDLPDSDKPGIVQQASLWNIDYLTTHHLNFSPIYIASGEDVSFGNYFYTKGIYYLYYEGIKVVKELAGNDDSEGAKAVKAAREFYIGYFADAEATVPNVQPLPAPPPPVQVKPTKSDEDGGVQKLADFIVNRVIPKAQGLKENEKSDDAVKTTAKCQGVEQIMCGAIKGRKIAQNEFKTCVTNDALDTTFKINGDDAQAVARIDTT